MKKHWGMLSVIHCVKGGFNIYIIKFINGRGVYSSIIPPPRGGKESKALRAREENQRRVKKKGREGERKGEGKGKREEKEKRIRVQIC